MKLLRRNKRDALPYSYYYAPLVVLTIAGIINSAYLALSHYYNYTDISYVSFCALSKAINCDTVSQSPWSILFGLPVALWGLLGYLIFGIILIPARKHDSCISLFSVLLTLSLIYSFASLYFAYISSVKIQSYCILCIFSYLINFGLCFYSWIVWRRFGARSFPRALLHSGKLIGTNKFLCAAIPGAIAVWIVMGLLLPRYWELGHITTSGMVKTGFTEDGHPWMGAENPQITIEEFTDYQCFQCYKIHFALRRIIENAPATVRLVHRHYPLDHEVNPIIASDPFHVGSGKLAVLAIAASRQQKFWETNDLIYQKLRNKQTSIDFADISKALDLDTDMLHKDFFSQESMKTLEKDIRAGLKHNITATPSFVIDGQVFQGTLPPSVLERLKTSK